MVEEILQLVQLRLGHDAVEGDGEVGTAARPVMGEVKRVLPVPKTQKVKIIGTFCLSICEKTK